METLIEPKPEWNQMLDAVTEAYEHGEDFEAVRLARELCDALDQEDGPEAEVIRERMQLITEALDVAA
ncbi:Protein of unknown function [Magnetospira sp. QH-2]|nr:Protein of unknown function [Magnetospira sp. QH-2]